MMNTPPTGAAPAPAAPPPSSDYSVEQRGGRFVVLDAGQPLIDFGSAIEAQAAVAALQADASQDTSEGGDEAASSTPQAAPPPNWQSSLMTGMAARGRKG